MTTADIKMVRAVRVKALPEYRLEITFDDRTAGVLDLSDLIRPGRLTGPLMDPDFFNRVFIEMGVPTWPNGFDIDAINAWMKLRDAGELRPMSTAA